MVFPDNLADKDISIYIHWPFCLSKCPYCDFNSHVATTKVNFNNWQLAFHKSIKYFETLLAGKTIKSVFFGGGTPSLMDPQLVSSILNLLSSLAKFSKTIEVTLEANPTSVEATKFKLFRLAGINRVSLGIQSLRFNNLQFLGRTHDVESAKQAAILARTIFPKFSFDLIYAMAGQDIEAWKEELQEAMLIAGDHISLYQLTVEKGTRFFSDYLKGKFLLPNDKVAANLYNYTNYYLKNLGYYRYEISNYSKIGAECYHNINYWNYGSYLGIGPGAHSRIVYYDQKTRKKSVKAITMQYNPQKWLDSVLIPHGNGIKDLYSLTNKEVIQEVIIMGLRLSTGISQDRLLELTEYNFQQALNMEYIQQLQDTGYIIMNNNIIKLTSKAMMVYNYIVNKIIPDK
ncbi:radical SAM superfamily protein [Orientia chuto str. Dubai]|uniref:Heme chaperone HemW n=1 Tax=Orientia chuto str. Dubai TaxID=1359168 RepID=A0A0F3MMM5_9RICK|nr:radical SAM family heme chaperone HemW [Candidatus Orientia mediorientalis]KJV56911.1 radical SAM superfamily protein [Orientia chuto str. Dubai]